MHEWRDGVGGPRLNLKTNPENVHHLLATSPYHHLVIIKHDLRQVHWQEFVCAHLIMATLNASNMFFWCESMLLLCCLLTTRMHLPCPFFRELKHLAGNGIVAIAVHVLDGGLWFVFSHLILFVNWRSAREAVWSPLEERASEHKGIRTMQATSMPYYVHLVARLSIRFCSCPFNA